MHQAIHRSKLSIAHILYIKPNLAELSNSEIFFTKIMKYMWCSVKAGGGLTLHRHLQSPPMRQMGCFSLSFPTNWEVSGSAWAL